MVHMNIQMCFYYLPAFATAFAARPWRTPFAELSRGFRAWRFCFRGGFPTWTRILNPFMEVFDAAQLDIVCKHMRHYSVLYQYLCAYIYIYIIHGRSSENWEYSKCWQQYLLITIYDKTSLIVTPHTTIVDPNSTPHIPVLAVGIFTDGSYSEYYIYIYITCILKV